MEKALARTSEQGSRQLVWAAVGGEDQLDQMRGAYISLARISEASDFVISEEGQAFQGKLWVCQFFHHSERLFLNIKTFLRITSSMS